MESTKALTADDIYWLDDAIGMLRDGGNTVHVSHLETLHDKLVTALAEQGEVAQPAAEGRQPGKVRYARAYGLTRSQIRDNLPPDLWAIGDTVLVWANQGDLCFAGMEFPASPGIASQEEGSGE